MNNVSLVGRLTKDVELRYTTKKVKAVGTFILAVDRDLKKSAGERVTDFIPVVTWGKTAEFAGKYFAKGQRIALQGSIHTRTWEDDDKNKHYVTEVVADKLFFADSRQKDQDEADTKEEFEITEDSMETEDENSVIDEAENAM